MHFGRLAPALVGVALLLTGSAHAQAVATTKTTRTYDCTKAGNANKTACKTAATAKPAAAPAAATVTRTTAARNYDCTKAGNANKAVCKNAAKPAVAAAAPVAPAPVAATATRTTAVLTQQTSRTTTTGAAVHAAGPNGATAQCKDGTYSKSTHRAGTCAGHKGVQTWY